MAADFLYMVVVFGPTHTARLAIDNNIAMVNSYLTFRDVQQVQPVDFDVFLDNAV